MQTVARWSGISVDTVGGLLVFRLPASGFSAELLPYRTFLGTPMHHRGVHVGNFYLVEKANGQAFGVADESVLLVFATQAAAAVANARAYRDEQRARADLEALVETSPVGVVVFDTATGGAVSVNREARRIVEGLCAPGCTAEDLLETLVYRRPDGREIALAELPMAAVLKSAETVRAEEIELSVADGRSLTVLVNATMMSPIRGEDDALVSVVVTMTERVELPALLDGAQEHSIPVVDPVDGPGPVRVLPGPHRLRAFLTEVAEPHEVRVGREERCRAAVLEVPLMRVFELRYEGPGARGLLEGSSSFTGARTDRITSGRNRFSLCSRYCLISSACRSNAARWCPTTRYSGSPASIV